MMNKKINSLMAVYLIVLIIYNVCYFIVPFRKGEASWVVYAFSIIAIIVGLASTCYAFFKKGNLTSKIYGFPVFRIGYLYLIAQLLFSILIFILDNYVVVAIWVSVVISVCLLGIAAIGLIITDNTRDIIEEQQEQDVSRIKAMTYFKIDVEGLESLCQSDELRKKIVRLIEEIKYSDPVSSEELLEIEEKLKEEVEKLSRMLVEKRNAEVEEQLQKVKSMLRERNQRCKISKK